MSEQTEPIPADMDRTAWLSTSSRARLANVSGKGQLSYVNALMIIAVADRLAWLEAEHDALRACLALGLRVVTGLMTLDRAEAWFDERDRFIERARALVGEEVGGG